MTEIPKDTGIGMTPETLESFEFSIPSDPALAEALRLWMYRHRCAWEVASNRLEQWEAEAQDKNHPEIRPMTRLENAYMDLEGKFGQAQARIEALEKLLEEGRAILSNRSIVKVEGDLVGHVVFGSWSERVDAALAAKENPTA